MAELIALIHQVNPTDRAVGEAERARRYALKSRLQSRLVREWADHLDIRAEEGEILSLHHRGHARDAAHVPRSALDFEALAIVDARLAFGADGPAAPAPDPVSAEGRGGDPLSTGRAALEDWDYDGARAIFSDVLAREGSEPAAHALLELLVETLALDHDALAVSVPLRALSPRVARLVAIAAARAGSERADELLPRLDRAGAIDVRLLLGEGALRAGDLRGAQTHLTALQELDPANGAVLALSDQLRRALAAPLAPLEAELGAALAAGDPTRIRAAAEALRAASPAHPGAKGALASLLQRERAADATRHVEAAQRHAAAGRVDLEVAALERAESLVPGAAPGLADARSRLAAERERLAVEAARSALEAGDLAPWLALPPRRRAELRSDSRDPGRLDLLEQLAGERDPIRALRTAEEAGTHLAAGEPGQALSLLEGARLLDHPALRKCVRDCRALLVVQQREAAIAQVDAVESAAAAGREAEALGLAERLRSAPLPDADRARLNAVVQRLQRRATDRADVDVFERMMASSSLFHGLDFAAARRADPVWARRFRAVEERVRAIFLPCGLDPDAVPLRQAAAPVVQLSADACLEADGRHAWLCESVAHWCYLRRIEVGTSRVVALSRIRMTDPMGRPRVSFFGDRVLLGGGGGRFLGLELGPDGVVSRVIEHSSNFDGSLHRAEYVDTGRDPSFRPVIRDIGPQGTLAGWVIWDAGTDRRSISAFTDVAAACPIFLPGRGPRLLLQEDDGQVTLYDPARQKPEGRVGYAMRIFSAAPCPRGDGVVCCGSFAPAGPDEVAIARLDPARVVPKARAALRGVDGFHPMATSRDLGLVFVLSEQQRRWPTLTAFDADLRMLWQVEAPGVAQILTDVEDRHVAVAVQTRRGLRVVPLGPTAPELPEDPLRPTHGYRHYWGATPAHDVARPAASWPEADRIRAAIAASDAERTPAGRFRALDLPEVWECNEVQSLCRLAEAALTGDGIPEEQRFHALAAYFDAFCRLEQHGAADPNELPGAPTRRTRVELEATFRAAREWILARAAALGWVETAPGRANWPSTRDW